MTASNLVKVGLNGEVLSDVTGLSINPSGFVIHGAIDETRPDAVFVLHTHTYDGMAVSCQEGGLLPIGQHAAAMYHELSYHDSEGIAVNMGERARITANLGTRNLLIFRNGLLRDGPRVGIAFRRMFNLERACQVQVRALSGRGQVISITPSGEIWSCDRAIRSLPCMRHR